MTTQQTQTILAADGPAAEIRPLRGLFQPPRRVRTIVILSLAVVTAAVCWYVGMDVAHAIAIAIVIAAVGVTWIAVPEHEVPEWAEEELRTGDGVRFDVMRLSWMLRSRRRTIQTGGLRRAREIAKERLARFGFDLDNPADRSGIETLIGRGPYATLWPTADRMPRLNELVRCLDALDRLDPSTSVRPTTSSARPQTAPSESGRGTPGPTSTTWVRGNLPEIRMPKLEERA
jgi:hypothetical protein